MRPTLFWHYKESRLVHHDMLHIVNPIYGRLADRADMTVNNRKPDCGLRKAGISQLIAVLQSVLHVR